jgi:thiamine biosynthesis lipoprotein
MTRRLRPALGTWVGIHLTGPASALALRRRMDEGFAAIETVERLMSVHRSDSELSQLNQLAPQRWIRLEPWTMAVLKMAHALWEDSQGAFDLRTGAVLAQWGQLPAQSKPEATQGWANLPALEFRGSQVRKTGPWILDLGGIAKGFAVDQAVKLLSSDGRSGSVNAGGDLRIWGSPQSVQIRGNSWAQSLPPLTGAVASSAIRPFKRRPRHSWHIRPSTTRALHRGNLATVFAQNCASADALTKIVLLAPPKVAARCLSLRGAKALLFSPEGELMKAYP